MSAKVHMLRLVTVCFQLLVTWLLASSCSSPGCLALGHLSPCLLSSSLTLSLGSHEFAVSQLAACLSVRELDAFHMAVCRLAGCICLSPAMLVSLLLVTWLLAMAVCGLGVCQLHGCDYRLAACHLAACQLTTCHMATSLSVNVLMLIDNLVSASCQLVTWLSSTWVYAFACHALSL